MASSSEELASLCESIAARERHIRDFYRHHWGEGGWQALLSRDLAIVPAIEENYTRIFAQLKEKYAGEQNTGGGDLLLAEFARHMALTAVSEDRARRLHPDQLAGYERLVEWRKRVGGLGAPPELGDAGGPAYERALEEQQHAIRAHLESELADSGAHTDELAQMARTIAGHRLHAAYAAKMAAS